MVVSDEPELLATYIATRHAVAFPARRLADPDGHHPWHGRAAWEGHGVLMLQRPGRRRTRSGSSGTATSASSGAGTSTSRSRSGERAEGYDTQDLELDIWAPLDGPWEWKDDELLDERVAEGRFTADQVAAIRAEGARVGALLDAGERWWDDWWASGCRTPAGTRRERRRPRPDEPRAASSGVRHGGKCVTFLPQAPRDCALIRLTAVARKRTRPVSDTGTQE